MHSEPLGKRNAQHNHATCEATNRGHHLVHFNSLVAQVAQSGKEASVFFFEQLQRRVFLVKLLLAAFVIDGVRASSAAPLLLVVSLNVAHQLRKVFRRAGQAFDGCRVNDGHGSQQHAEQQVDVFLQAVPVVPSFPPFCPASHCTSTSPPSALLCNE